MKGIIKLYFNAPNTAKVRSRVENPTPNFTQNLRAAIQEAAEEVLNESTYKIRAKLIEKFAAMGETIKDAKATAALTSVLNPYFDVVVAIEKENLPGGEEEAEAEPQKEEKAEEDFED